MTALDGVPARAAATQLSMKIANVYAARSNVQRLVREELARLDGNPDDSSGT